MTDTKENILLIALQLFARDGYEAVSVSTIAGKLGMTKGALYKHYKNKRDIFDSIVERMYQIDAKHAKEYEVPEETFDKDPLAYRNISLERISKFIRSQLYFWGTDEFACNFRKMLTLEQYRNTRMTELYQTVFVSGPVSYIEDLFSEMKNGVLNNSNSKLLALELYSPLFLMMNISDISENIEKYDKLLMIHVDNFIERNTNEELKNI